MISMSHPVVTQREFKILLDSCKKKEQLMSFSILYYSGLKISELESFDWNFSKLHWLPDNYDSSWDGFKPKLKRRALQVKIKNSIGKSLTSLRMGFYNNKLNQGYSPKYILEKMGLSLRSLERSIYRNMISPSVSDRVRVFSRDNFQCQFCGKQRGDVKIEIDHIIPVSLGGNSKLNNLQTLCRDCNIGKGQLKILKEQEGHMLNDSKQNLYGERL